LERDESHVHVEDLVIIQVLKYKSYVSRSAESLKIGALCGLKYTVLVKPAHPVRAGGPFKVAE
jgi:hypothetical protein